MAYLTDNILDNGLAALKAAADRIFLCSQEPATYTQATSTYAVGNKDFGGAGAVYPNAIAAGAPSGRKLTSAPVLAAAPGSITATGDATHSAVVSSGVPRLEVAQALEASQPVTSGNTFTLTGADVRLPNLGG
ncbi:MAG: hypothetical protein ACJ8DZ_14125 [Allosphingosinicella sp.]